MPILGVIASSKLATPAPVLAYDSIATVTLSGSQSSITFSSIPSTYTHLQIRGVGRTNRSNYSVELLYIRFNGDTGGNYSTVGLNSDGVNMYTYPAANSATFMYGGQIATSIAGTGAFGVTITDILDYKSTTKNKSVRSVSGVEPNASYSGSVYGGMNVMSGLYMNTSAITSITLTTELSGNFLQFSSYALYGIK